MSDNGKYTNKEEIASGITHGLGILFGVAVLITLLILVVPKRKATPIIAFSIYGVCLILMYLSSTLYHSIKIKKIKRILRVFDHSSIYLFIAGTYTPLVLLAMKGKLRMGIMISIWTIAILGIIFKILTIGKFDKYKAISLATYIAMGWIALFTIKPIIKKVSLEFMLWILGGGLVYTLGTIFYNNKKIPFNHAIWHLFVLGGTVLHFVAILLFLV